MSPFTVVLLANRTLVQIVSNVSWEITCKKNKRWHGLHQTKYYLKTLYKLIKTQASKSHKSKKEKSSRNYHAKYSNPDTQQDVVTSPQHI